MKGTVFGIDLTPEIIKISKQKLNNRGILNLKLEEGDARNLTYKNNYFDAVYISSTLELLDIPDLPVVLKEIKRVLKPKGKLCTVNTSKENCEKSFGVRIYEWSHKTFPDYASCRPIYVEDSIKNA